MLDRKINYVFIVCLYLATATEGQPAPSDPKNSKDLPDTFTLASVREYPLYLHRCTATFVSSNFLLTTAECVLCPDQCNLQVRIHSDHLSDREELMKDNIPIPVIFNVIQVIYHPDYPMDPETHNVALIEIDGNVEENIIYNYANFTPETFGIKGRMYAWQFSPDKRDYFLHRKEGKTVANQVCSFSLKKYIPSSYMCVAGDQLLSMGPFDYGSPFIISHNQKPMMVGIYDDSGSIHDKKFVTYQTIQPFYSWIKEITSSVSNPADVLSTNSQKLPTKPITKTPATKPPKPTTKAPKPITKGPNPTTKGPNPTTKGANPTTKGPKPTTKGPNPTTKGAKPTTIGPKPTTKGPKPAPK